ncbi:hypothetical protein Pan2_100 [Pseudanabaena phage Pan2]|nr:hypothetical protein Pan2_100 [Pseudanabaena phage Pan2]
MRIFANDSLNPGQAVELFISLVDAGSEMNVWLLDVAGEERVFFEVFEEGDALDIIDAAFEARRRMKEDSNG